MLQHYQKSMIFVINNVGSFDLGTISCASGIGVPSSDESARMYLTNNGGAIVRIDDGDTTDGEQIIVALT